MVQIPPTTQGWRGTRGIPPTAVGGWFRSRLPLRAGVELEESHQRQLVNGSDPAYHSGLAWNSWNPTNGSWWMVQIPPTTQGWRGTRGIPPTAVGEWFRSRLPLRAGVELVESHQRQLVDGSDPAYHSGLAWNSRNPTNGSW